MRAASPLDRCCIISASSPAPQPRSPGGKARSEQGRNVVRSTTRGMACSRDVLRGGFLPARLLVVFNGQRCEVTHRAHPWQSCGGPHARACGAQKSLREAWALCIRLPRTHGHPNVAALVMTRFLLAVCVVAAGCLTTKVFGVASDTLWGKAALACARPRILRVVSQDRAQEVLIRAPFSTMRGYVRHPVNSCASASAQPRSVKLGFPCASLSSCAYRCGLAVLSGPFVRQCLVWSTV